MQNEPFSSLNKIKDIRKYLMEAVLINLLKEVQEYKLDMIGTCQNIDVADNVCKQ